MKNANILVLTYWSYRDALVQTYTLPYLPIIRKNLPANSRIYLVTLEQSHQLLNKDEAQREKIKLRNEGIYWMPFRYRKFRITSIIPAVFLFISVLYTSLSRNIRAIHAWCMPAGAFGYILSLFSGKPLIVDSYEPHAEAMAENGTWDKSSMSYKVLFSFEKHLSKHAVAVIGVTGSMKDYAFNKYGVQFEHYCVKPACVDTNIFTLIRRKNITLLNELQLSGKIICVYAGKFGGIYLQKEVFDFFRIAEEYWGEKFRVLLLTSTSKEELNALAKQSGFDEKKMIVRFVPHNDIPDYIGLGDFAITPVKPVPTKRHCTPIKDGEYWSMGLPVVITKDISDDSQIIEEQNIGAVIRELTGESYNEAIKKIDLLLTSEKPEVLAQRIHSIAVKYRSFSVAENIYKSIYGESGIVEKKTIN